MPPESVSIDLKHPSHDEWLDDCSHSGTKRTRERAATLWEELLTAAPPRCGDEPAESGSTWSGYFNTLSLRRHVSADLFTCEAAAEFAGLMQAPPARSVSSDYEKSYPQGTSSPAASRPFGFSGVVSALDPRDSPNSPLSLDLSYECSVCHLRFATVHALGGHKSVHNVKKRPHTRSILQRSYPRSHSDNARTAGDSNPGNRLDGDVVLLVDAAARLTTCANQDSPRERDPSSQMQDSMSGMSNAQPANSCGTKEDSELVVDTGKRAALLAEIRGLLQLKRQRSCSSQEESLGFGDRDVLSVGEGENIPKALSGTAEMDVVDLSLHL